MSDLQRLVRSGQGSFFYPTPKKTFDTEQRWIPCRQFCKHAAISAFEDLLCCQGGVCAFQMMSAMTSPLELLDQLELSKRLEGEAQTAAAAVGDITSLPKGRGVYQKQLNVFYRADPAAALAAARKEHETKQKQHKEVQILDEYMF
jgi:hypothetical protein